MSRVRLSDLHKRFGATRALDGASLELEAGEVHALLGENGAGKTTLVRALFGLVRPDRGTIELDGEVLEIRGPAHALALGIGLVPQHSTLIPALSVAENLAIGESGGVWLGRAELAARARPILERAGLDLDPDLPAERLAIAAQQRLEIARALARDARVLILDEPTAVLAPPEVDDLLALLGQLRRDGRSVLFISHKLAEITAVCDRVTVLRHGRDVATRAVAGIHATELGRWMVGDDPPPPGVPPSVQRGEPALRLEGVRAEGLGPVDLELCAGEIVALAGVDGNGQSRLEELLAGVRPASAGRVELLRGPLALLSGDRQRTGLILELSLEENLALEDATGRSCGAWPGEQLAHESPFRAGLLRTERLRGNALAAIERFAIRGEPGLEVRALSGGNQQKLCVARALQRAPGVLVCVNPTRGLDLGSTAAVREELRAAARAGCAVLLISTDLDEVLELGTRVLVIFRGQLFDAEAERGRIGELMLGTGVQPSRAEQ